MLKKIIIPALLSLSFSVQANVDSVFGISFDESLPSAKIISKVKGKNFYDVLIPKNEYFNEAIVYTDTNRAPLLVKLKNEDLSKEQANSNFLKMTTILTKKYGNSEEFAETAEGNDSYFSFSVFGVDITLNIEKTSKTIGDEQKSNDTFGTVLSYSKINENTVKPSDSDLVLINML